MVEEMKEAMQNKEIQDAIVTKISRERVGEEFDKMMKGEHVARKFLAVPSSRDG